MYLSIFFKLLLAQLVTIFIVVCCLKLVLDKQLLVFAYRKLDCWKPKEGSKVLPARVEVITHRPISDLNRKRFESITAKRIGSTELSFNVDRSLWGGAIVRVGEDVFDCSLKDRLRQAWH